MMSRATNRTIYTDKTELFITFRPPFIVGKVVRVGAHLSKLGERFLLRLLLLRLEGALVGVGLPGGA